MTAVDSAARWQMNFILLHDDGKSFRIQMELDCQFDSLNCKLLSTYFPTVAQFSPVLRKAFEAVGVYTLGWPKDVRRH